MAKRSEIKFILGDEPVTISGIDPTRTLIDWLRIDRRMIGTKEGCAEGDCGACTVLVGRLEHGVLRYRPVNTCIRFVSTLDGCHVLSVEHLKAPDGTLHPVQQAMVEHHGSQCGFCTPGIVMSLYALWLSDPDPSADDVERALQGNLCRCTGYEPIIKAGLAMGSIGDRNADRWIAGRDAIALQLAALADGARIEIEDDARRFIQPANADDLAEVFSANPDATIVAGATDVGLWVTKGMRKLDSVINVGGLDDLNVIETTDDVLRIGAGVSYADAWPVLAARYPAISELVHRIGGAQVRAMGTIGGNLANGSPIGDTPPPFIALDAKIGLRHGHDRRSLPLEDFFIDYGKQDRQPGEFVEWIDLPELPETSLFRVYKISKRFEEDISTVCAAFRIDVNGAGTVTAARFAMGGMAGTPSRAKGAESAVIGRGFDETAIEAAIAALAIDFTPLSDWRASANYRTRAAQGLLRRFYLETKHPETPARIVREGRLADA